MAYVRNWLHCVWGTKKRVPFITSDNKIKIISHIRENAKNKSIYIDFINAHIEHVHCIISLSADQSIAKVMQLIKGESSFWINKNSITKGRFEWADEYYAASISESQIHKVRDYIKNQEEHHRIRTWEEEYSEFLQEYTL
ncbi:hypothetical protein ES705_11061 [subsurface metagenome]